MIIIDSAFKSLAEYLSDGKGYEVSRPAVCPWVSCGESNCFWKHTAYSRDVLDNEEPVSLTIQRFKCRYCGLVVSYLFSFLVPYRRYSATVVAGSAELYATAPVLKALASYRKIADNVGCARMSVFRWVESLGTKSQGLRSQVQKEFMLAGRAWQTLSAVPEEGKSPSAGRAKSTEKEKRLNELFGLVEISKVFFCSVESVLEKLHTYFLKNVESPQLILCGRTISNWTQQKLGHVLR